jgi:UDP-N-acetyl-2-amino-2-deoxyglucuronate dehydrogenase
MPEQIDVALLTHAQGAHLEAYYAALAACPEVARVAVADPGGDTFAAARQALGEKLARSERDAATLLREFKPAMALVSMEAAQAPPVIDAALEAGCHVFAEKPACIEAADFEKLLRKAQSKHLHLMLALANRVTPPVREARRLFQEGRLGKLYGVELHLIADQTRITREEYRQSWFAQKAKAGGGHLIWLGIHWLDLAMFITGQAIESVAGFTAVVGGQPIDVEDSAAFALRFAGGALGTMTSGYYLKQGYHAHIKIWGQHGWLELADLDATPLRWHDDREHAADEVATLEYASGLGGYTPFVRAAVRACAGLEEAPVTGEECLRVLQTVFGCYQAAEARITVSVT